MGVAQLNEYLNGTGRLPHEEVMAKGLKINWGVLRDVLASLEAEGYQGDAGL